MKQLKKLLAIILAVAMILGTPGAKVLADEISDTEESDGQHEVRVEYDWYLQVGGDCYYVEDGKTLEEIPPAKCDGYEFLGYYWNGKEFDYSTPITQDIVLQIRWKIKPLKEVPDVNGKEKDFPISVGGTGAVMGEVIDSNETLWSFSECRTDKVAAKVKKYYSNLVYGDEHNTIYWNNFYVLDADGVIKSYKKAALTAEYEVVKYADKVRDFYYTKNDEKNFILTEDNQLLDFETKAVIRNNVKKFWEFGYNRFAVIDIDNTLRICSWNNDKLEFSEPLNGTFKGMYEPKVKSDYWGKQQYAEMTDGIVWNLVEQRAVAKNEVPIKAMYTYFGIGPIYLNDEGKIFYYENDKDLENRKLTFLPYNVESIGNGEVILLKSGEAYNLKSKKTILKDVRKISNCTVGSLLMYLTKKNDLFITYTSGYEVQNEDIFKNATKLMSGVKDFNVVGFNVVIIGMDGSIWNYNPGVKGKELVEAIAGNEVVKEFKQKKAAKTSITLSWKKVQDCTGYEIYRKPYKSGKYKKIATVKASKNSYTDKKLKKEILYRYKIRMYRKVNGKTKYAPFTKEIIANTAINDVSLSKAKSSKKKQITLSWKKVKSISGFEIYRSTKKNGTYKKIATVKNSKTSYVDKRVTSKKKYYYKMRTYKKISGKKVYGAYSKIKSAKAK